jgi:hypothetical protein
MEDFLAPVSLHVFASGANRYRSSTLESVHLARHCSENLKVDLHCPSNWRCGFNRIMRPSRQAKWILRHSSRETETHPRRTYCPLKRALSRRRPSRNLSFHRLRIFVRESPSRCVADLRLGQRITGRGQAEITKCDQGDTAECSEARIAFSA